MMENEFICLGCEHNLDDHACSQYRSYWFCETPNCDCQDFENALTKAEIMTKILISKNKEE